MAEVLLATLAFYRERGDFRLHAYVVMPDHVHLLLTPVTASLSDIMRNFKGYAAKAMREEFQLEHRIWQSRFHDRAIRDENAFSAAVGYIHLNPVVAGLVSSPELYPFSSAAAFAGLSARPTIDGLIDSRLEP